MGRLTDNSGGGFGSNRPLIQHTGDDLADRIATANHYCTRPELEWVRDGQGGMRLDYKHGWSRANARMLEEMTEAERQRYARNYTRQPARDFTQRQEDYDADA